MGVVVGAVGVPGSTGNFSVSGLGFEPVAVVFFNQFNDLGEHSAFIGAATGSSEQWVIWAGGDTEISAYTNRKHRGRTDRCCLQYQEGGLTATIAWACSMVSLDSDGFTLNLTERSSVDGSEGGNIYYMALGGDHITEAHAGTFDAGTSTGTTAVTAPGFKPTCAIFAHSAGTGGWSAVVNGTGFGVGVTDGTSQYACWSLSGTGGAAGPVAHIHRTNAVACYYDGTSDIVIEWDSWDTNGFTVDCTNSGGTLRNAYLALKADNPVAGMGTQPNSNTALTYNTPGLEPGGVFFCWNGVDTPSTTGATTGPLRPGWGAGTVSAYKSVQGIFRATAPFGVSTSDGFQNDNACVGFWGRGIATDPDAVDPRAEATISGVDMGSYELNWTNVADTTDRVFGWLALPGEIEAPWIPRIYRRDPGW